MCACSHDFTCPRCADTPADPNYLEDEVIVPKPVYSESLAEYEAFGPVFP